MPSRLFCCFGGNASEEGFLEEETAKCNLEEQKGLSTESDKIVSINSANRIQFTDIGDVTSKVIFDKYNNSFYVPILYSNTIFILVLN